MHHTFPVPSPLFSGFTFFCLADYCRRFLYLDRFFIICQALFLNFFKKFFRLLFAVPLMMLSYQIIKPLSRDIF
nr:MAG TPA: hypothetical protein [Caudoviricetes sp.]